MIESIKNKGLRLFFEHNDASKLPAAQIEKIRSVLTILHNADSVEEINLPGSKMHPLKGEYLGFWACKNNRQLQDYFPF